MPVIGRLACPGMVSGERLFPFGGRLVRGLSGGLRVTNMTVVALRRGGIGAPVIGARTAALALSHLTART